MPSAPIDLARLGAGFVDPVGAAQRTFRCCLEALSRPGTLITLDEDVNVPPPLAAAAGALALALLDQDTALWLSPALAATGGYLRFHTGCRVVEHPGAADFAIVSELDQVPALRAFRQGNDEFPEHSSTLILQSGGLDTARGWTLSGPGIDGARALHVSGLDARFVTEWQLNRAQFPAGVDIVFASGNQLCGLPRSTRISN